MTQQCFVSKGRTIRGPVTDRQRTVNPRTGKVAFNGTPGKVYRSHDENGNPKPLPSGFVDWLQNTKDTNGQSKFQNMVESGYIVFEAGGSSPVEFAKAFAPDLISKGGVIVEDPNPKAATK